MTAKTEATHIRKQAEYPAGQRLYCRRCGSEIEIINPCTCQPSKQSFTCCNDPMTPTAGGNVHLGVE